MLDTNSNRDGNRVLENGRLVYYYKTANQKYWENIWENYLTQEFFKPYQNGNLFEYEKIFNKHLKKDGRILEAGCGTAQFVVALNALSYNCFGLDFAINTLTQVQQLAGPLKLISGDITALGISNNSFDAVISIGVVEHRRAGPEPFLQEMTRILKPGGLLLISVPYFNPLRLWRSRKGAYQDNVKGLDFYQYAFTKDEFSNIIKDAGYEIETHYSYAHQNTLSQELHWLKKIHPFLKKLIFRISKYVPYVNSEIGHMLMVVARKKVST